MRRLAALLILFGMTWAVPQEGLAFKLNPCLRVLTIHEDSLGQEPIRGINPCGILPDELRYAVHEHMSIAAIAAYRNKNLFRKGAGNHPWVLALNYMSPDIWQVGTGYRHDTTAIVFGTWWNDDPNMYLLGGSGDFRKGASKFRDMFSSRRKATLRSDLNCPPIPVDQHIGHTSHFGALQHIHFMTSLGKEHNERARLQATIEEALVWIEFAYKVAKREIKATDPLTPEDEKRLKLPPIAVNICLANAANTKVRSIFTRQGPATQENLDYRNRITPDVALGSIFHLLQDSFSPAHACRVRLQRNGQSMAALRQVFNYNEQDHDRHSAQDGYPDWLMDHIQTRKHRYANDPVAVGAWLLGAVDKSMQWSDVKAHLLSTAFLQEPEDRSTAKEACIK